MFPKKNWNGEKGCLLMCYIRYCVFIFFKCFATFVGGLNKHKYKVISAVYKI